MRRSLFHNLMVMLKWIFVCTGIGFLVSLIYWLMWLVFNDKSLGKVASGEVEDAVGTFQGMILLGCLIGFFVGIVFGLKRVLV
jgi:hypothetical protein